MVSLDHSVKASHAVQLAASRCFLLESKLALFPSPMSKSDVSDLDQSYMAKPGNTRVWRGEGKRVCRAASKHDLKPG
jgi:hypothetical protein